MPVTAAERNIIYFLEKPGQNVDITTESGAQVNVRLQSDGDASVRINTKRRNATLWLRPKTRLPLCQRSKNGEEEEAVVIENL